MSVVLIKNDDDNIDLKTSSSAIAESAAGWVSFGQK